MGIKGLYSYINVKFGQLLDSYQLDNTKLIIDGSSISFQLLEQSQKDSPCASDGVYQTYSKCVTNFFNKLIDHKVDILVILDGAWEPRQQNYMLQRLKNSIGNTTNYCKLQLPRTTANHKNDLFYSTFINNIFLDVLKKLKINFLICTFSSTKVIVTVGKILNYPILTANSELFIYGINCIFFHSLNIYEKKNQSSNGITCKIISPDKFVKSFPGLKVSCLPILSVLLGQHLFKEDDLFKFYKLKFSSSFRRIQNFIPHVLIEKTLKWLSNHTLQSAAQEIIPLMMSTGKPSTLSKKIIEDIINNFKKTSTYMLKHFANLQSFKIDEAKVSGIQNKFTEFKFDFKETTVDSNVESAKNESQDLKKITTNCFIEEHLTGKLSSFVINLIEHETYIPWYQVEHFEYPSIYEMSVPLISFIYGLLLSCTEEEKIRPLKLYIREKLNIQCREITVEKYPQRLEDIRKSDMETKLEIINEVLLGLKKADSLEGLPKNWRLFTATIVFWMKQKSNPEKGEIYLYTLLLAMFFTISEKKLKGSDEDDSPDKGLVNEDQRLSTENNSEFKPDQSLQITKAIANINVRHASIAKLIWLFPEIDTQILDIFFGRHSNHMPSVRCDDKNSGQSDISLNTIHILMQFQCCLEHSRTLNALLGFPYHQPDINDIFNTTLIRNIFMDISRQSTNPRDYICHNMQIGSPTVLKAFKLLATNVNSLL